MSELRPGTGYESLSEVPRDFVDYVNDHARQGAWADKEVGPSHASYLYDVDLSDMPQFIPFDHVLFEDSQYEGLAPSRRVQKDQVTFFLGNVRLTSLYHEIRPDGGSIFLLYSNENALRDPGEAIVATILQQFSELEQAGKMVPTPDQRLPEAT